MNQKCDSSVHTVRKGQLPDLFIECEDTTVKAQDIVLGGHALAAPEHAEASGEIMWRIECRILRTIEFGKSSKHVTPRVFAKIPSVIAEALLQQPDQEERSSRASTVVHTVFSNLRIKNPV